MTSVSRGDIVWVTFDEDTPDAEFDDPHMAVVIQNNDRNEKLDSTVVIPISSRSLSDFLTEVELSSEIEGLTSDSIAILTQISTVSVPDRIFDEGDDESIWKAGEIPRDKITEIEHKLTYLLGVGGAD